MVIHTNAVQIETLQQHEKADYAQILLASYAQYKEVYPSQEAWESYAQNILESVDSPQAEKILVAKVDGKILGGLQLFTDSVKAYGLEELNIHNAIVRLLGVHPDGRGKGIAKHLLQASFDFARERGDDYLYLHSTYMMDTAIQLYLKLGFERDVSRNFVKSGILVQCFRFRL